MWRLVRFDNILMMLSQEDSSHPVSLSDTEIWDPLSKQTITYRQGALFFQAQDQQQPRKVTLAVNQQSVSKIPSCLKFKKTQNHNLLISPSGHYLSCKSSQLQQCDLNMSYSSGIALWGMYCSGNCLALTVGVRNSQTSEESTIDLAAQNPLKISFRLNLTTDTFEAWGLRTAHQLTRNLKVGDKNVKWTPFVRLKGIGVKLFVSDMIEDPLQQISIYNVLTNFESVGPAKISLTAQSEQEEAHEQAQTYTMNVLDSNSILLKSDHTLKLIRRSNKRVDFCEELTQCLQNGNVKIHFTKQEIYQLQCVGIEIQGQVGEDNFVYEKTEKWMEQVSHSFVLLDAKLRSHQYSKQLIERCYEILLRKVEGIRQVVEVPIRSCPAFETSQFFAYGLNQLVLPLPSTDLSIPRSIALNNEPALRFADRIKQMIWTDNHIFLVLEQSSRVYILNRQDSLFVVGDMNLKQGLKKETELSRFQKELEELQSGSRMEPCIYKILKNCLKYADKVKPPQKVLDKMTHKAKEKDVNKQKKQKPPNQKSDGFVPNQTWINTFVSMGFESTLAKKALIKCKNSSFEAAMELILKPEELEPCRKMTGEWSCSECTLKNNAIALVCDACGVCRQTSQFEKEEDLMMIKQEKPEDEVVEQEITSPNIDSQLISIYAWQTGVAYAPYLVAGVFDEKVRFRLFGPNPKYYSMFYSRDEQFVDLSNLEIHQQAFQIDQKPVRYQYYIGSSKQEQKQCAYGWVSIEDLDLQVQTPISNLTLSRLNVNKKQVSFRLTIKFDSNNKISNYEGKIVNARIFQQRQKAFSLTVSTYPKEPEHPQQKLNPVKQQRVWGNSRVIPVNGLFELDMALTNKINQQQQYIPEQVQANISDKPITNKQMLPICSADFPNSNLLTYPNCTLPANNKPTIFRHLNNRVMTVEYVVLEKIGKSVTNEDYTGYLWLSRNPTKIPLKKIKFTMCKGSKRISINCSSLIPCSFFAIELDGKQSDKTNTASEIGLVGAIGQSLEEFIESPIHSLNLTHVKFFDKYLQTEIVDEDSKQQSKAFKTNVYIKECGIDIELATHAELHSMIDGWLQSGNKILDLRLQIINMSNRQLMLRNCSITISQQCKWEIIATKSVYLKDKKVMLEPDYKDTLGKYINSPSSYELIKILIEESNQQYRNLILSPEHDLNTFLNRFLREGVRAHKKLSNIFLKKFADYLMQAHKTGKLNAQQIIVKYLQNHQEYSYSGVQIVFELIKLFPMDQKRLYQELQPKLQLSLSLRKSKKSHSESCKLSDTSASAKSSIINRYLTQKGKTYRKLIMDMFNVYLIKQIRLNFQKSASKVPMMIRVKSVADNGDLCKQIDCLYSESVFEQVAVSAYSEEMDRNVRAYEGCRKVFNSLTLPIAHSFQSRYLIIEIVFSSCPSSMSLKEIERVPHSQIFPEVHGDYMGETDSNLQIFETISKMSNMVFVKKFGDVEKYSVPDSGNYKNLSYYISEDVQLQDRVVEMVAKSDKQTTPNAQQIQLVVSLLLDEILKEKCSVPSENLLTCMRAYINGEREDRGLHDKIVAVLRKVCQQNPQLSEQLLDYKFSHESTFQQIYKQLTVDTSRVVRKLSGSDSTDLLTNVIWLLKSRPRSEQSREVLTKVMEHCLSMNRIEDMMGLVDKFGWPSFDSLVQIMDKLRQTHKVKLFKNTLRHCKDNSQLADYVSTLVSLSHDQQFEFFNMGLKELTKTSRKLKQSQIQPVLTKYMHCIQQQPHSDAHIEQFSILAKSINHFNISNCTLIQSFMETFMGMSNKRALLKQFLETEPLKQEKFVEKLTNMCLDILDQAFEVPQYLIDNNMVIIYDILVFLFRNQVSVFSEGGATGAYLLSQNTVMRLIKGYSTILSRQLCLGGETHIKLKDQPFMMKLLVASYLSTILSRNLGSVKPADIPVEQFRQLFEWLLISISASKYVYSWIPSSKNLLKREVSHWSNIESTVRELVKKCCGRSDVLAEQFDHMADEVSKIRSPNPRKIYQNKLYVTFNKLLDEAEDSTDVGRMIKDVLYERLLNKICRIDVQGFRNDDSLASFDCQPEDLNSIEETELVNLFHLEREPEKQPKNWLEYKNGCKNSVYRFNYPKSSKRAHEIILKHSDNLTTVNLSKIIIGFECKNTVDENYGIPSRIVVEAGANEHEMKLLGNMVALPDDYFISYSVRVFGLNCNSLNGFSTLSKCLNKHPSTNYIRITVHEQNNDYLSDALNIESSQSKSQHGSSINFLSIQGYESHSTQATYTKNPEITSLVELFRKLSQPEHKSTISQIFAEERSVSLFKESLHNISLLMKVEAYEKILHQFIMRVCEVNDSIGNETIQKYLSLNNSLLCSKIVTEIILSNPACLGDRLKTVNEFMMQNLGEMVQSHKFEPRLEPFMQRFSQILHVIVKEPNLYHKTDQKIQISVQFEVFLSLLRQPYKSETICKYICAILMLGEEESIVCTSMEYESVYDWLYTNAQDNADDPNFQIMYSLIVSNQKARTWFMQKNGLESLYDSTVSLITSKQPNLKLLYSRLSALACLSLNGSLKNIINKNRYNLDLFKTITRQEHSSLLIQQDSQKIREIFVIFITRSVLNSENEAEISHILRESLASNIVEQNQNFVGHVFLPILNSYSKAYLCVLPYERQEGRIVVDSSSLIVSNSKQSANPRKSGASKSSDTATRFRLPSTILTENSLKKQLFEQIKSKTNINGGQFNLCVTHGNDAFGLCNTLQNDFLDVNQSQLIIYKLMNNEHVNGVSYLGVFYYQQPTKPRTYPLTWNDKCLLFMTHSLNECDEHQIEWFDVSKQKDKTFLSWKCEDSFSDDCESEVLEILYNDSSLCEISFGIEWESSYFNPSVLRHGLHDMYELVAAEYWILHPSLAVVSEPKMEEKSSLTSEILLSSDFSFFPNQFRTQTVLRYLRYETVYEFPTSITVRELKEGIQIMKSQINANKLDSVKLKHCGSLKDIDDQVTLQQLLKRNSQYPVFDVLFTINDLSEMLNFMSGQPKSTEYLPKKGILKHFCDNNGVESMIGVLKKSIEGWANQERKEKWGQYVTELEKFSKFPHFFGMYLKDSDSFQLLFQLLSGLPSTDPDKKWEDIEAKASQKLLKIVSDILSMDKTLQFRQYALENDFFYTILQRLRILTGMGKRQYKQSIAEQQLEISPSKRKEDDGTKQVKKKKGVGYGNEGSSNTKWMKTYNQVQNSKQFQIIQIILNMIENFLGLRNWRIPNKLLTNIYESALLLYLQDGLRAGTLLEISKHPAKFKLVFKILETFARNAQLVPILMKIPENYQPRQIESLYSLLKSLENTASIFLSCLKNSKENSKAEKTSEELAKGIIETAQIVELAVEGYIEANQESKGEEIKNILEMPIDQQYRALMRELRFDYIDMKQGNRIKHHYNSSFSQNYVPNQNKMIRLAQELADISTALPYEHTNAVYVRCDKDRVDFMQALIMGSNGTPYGHGAFLFDVYFDDNYPNGPPKVNLTTTGHGKVRFNPNLYACGKVCLSLLGTWRGSASENWDPKVSTLLQVLLSIQAIIMSEEVYFNQPGFEHEQGTPEGEKKNQAYSNIVRYSNIKFAMIENIRNPPKGFETIIRRHFYIKQHQILEQCKKWLLYAEKRPANYISLVNDHNSSWSTEFKKTKTQYKEMLEKAIAELTDEFKKLTPPSIHDIVPRTATKKQGRQRAKENLLKKLEEDAQEEIDVAYEKDKDVSIGKMIDINDQKVKDRWSRYIGAMGIDAVSKQSKADILVYGLGPMALEVIKNLVLSGCRKLTICDDSQVRIEDLSGGFFFGSADIGLKRTQASLHKIRELNAYVKVDTITRSKATVDIIKQYHVVLVTEMSLSDQFELNQVCRDNKIKFISAEFRGAHCRLLNDFGDSFEVLDRNGEEPVEVIIKEITCEQTATVTLLDGIKCPFEDGEAVIIKNVQGMQHKQQLTKSINGTVHKVKTINSKSFMIGDTTAYTPYIRNGTAKNIKTPVIVKFKSMRNVYEFAEKELPVDQNLAMYDFVKIERNKIIHYCFVALDRYVQECKDYPKPWNVADANKFLKAYQELVNEEVDPKTAIYVRKFAMTCAGCLCPLAAFIGGFISQEIIKAITQKYTPVSSVFYMDAEEIIPDLPDDPANWNSQIKSIYTDSQPRLKGLEVVIGSELLQLIQNSKMFMIGAGAIGCELLKNFAMVGLGTGTQGKITLTDPDHIENSNLNRQFLFRQKHISKPKSRTAAASVQLMNPELKGHISALLERVSEKTKNIFSNDFFESLTFVANALDNVAARRYVDQRCVENKIPLFESGTLGSKGHTQVIIPYQTESYGSQQDPVEDGQIPHCTLKMFPEQTLHCIEWARDIFGKKFSLQPKAFQKIKDPGYKPEKEDIKSLNECILMARKGPRNFDDCISYAVSKFYKYFRDDILQLLYTYPLDAKTKNGQPFWKLPKRPPSPIQQLDAKDMLHCTFVTSMAVLVAKIYKIPFPQNFRSDKERLKIGLQAAEVKVPDFKPSDEKAKEILKESQNEEKKGEQPEKGENDMMEQSIQSVQNQLTVQLIQKEQSVPNQQTSINDKNQEQLYQQLMEEAKGIDVEAEQFEKDDDQNGHIDFIYAMANLRAINYKLAEMDWITTKLKAGRIVPALATTTTCIAGLQTLQICKYLRKLKMDKMRNSFLNLAVPSLQMSEPGEVAKFKLTENLSVNLWDRWEVPCTEQTTFGEVYQFLRDKYKLCPTGVLQGMSRIDTSKTEAGLKQFLASKVLDKLDREEKNIDMVVLFTKQQGDDKLLEHVPIVRLVFEK